jgi:hypothetical protein
VLADLHVHLYGCIRPIDLLHQVITAERVDWDWYEADFQAAFGFVPPTRQLVDRFRSGDESVVPAFTDLVVVGDADAGSFARFQAKGILKWAASDTDPRRFAGEVLEAAARVRADYIGQGVTHGEFRMFAISALLETYHNDSGPLTQRVVDTLPRGEDPGPALERITRAALGPHGEAIVAVDWSGVEEGHPPKELREAIKEVQAFNRQHPERALAILAHVGESFGDKSLESAIRWVQEVAELGAHRLGHAIALGIDPAMYGNHTRTESVAERRDQIAYDIANSDGLRAFGVPVDATALAAEHHDLASLDDDATLTLDYDDARLAEVKRRQDFAIERVRATGAVIEVCPTSNRRIGGVTDPSYHPVHRFLEAGLPVVVSTDDPGMFDISLAHELDWVCDHTGGGEELRRHLIDTAWRSRAECLSGRMAP